VASSSALDDVDPPQTRKIKSDKKTGNHGLTQAIGNMVDSVDRVVTAVFHRAHHECDGTKGTKPENEVSFIEAQMNDNVDFVGLSEYEASNTIDASKYNYGMIGAMCKHRFGEPIRLYHNQDKWSKFGQYPASDACQDPQNPPVGYGPGGSDPPAPWKCGKSDVVPTNTAEGECCSCNYAADKASTPNVEDRTWVAGLFYRQGKGHETKICVVATGMIHPYPVNGIPLEGTGTIDQEVANFCTNAYPIIFMADTNLARPDEMTASLFNKKPLSDLRDGDRDGAKPRWTCCKNDHAKHASDRIAVTGGLVIEKITGGASKSGGHDIPDDMGYQCDARIEHLPIKASIIV